jgi:hypothetical protein
VAAQEREGDEVPATIRFGALVVVAVAWVLAAAVFPSRPLDRSASELGAFGPDATGDELDAARPDGLGPVGTAPGDASGTGPGGAAGPDVGGPGTTGTTGTGITKGGIDCRPGVRQLPNSTYALPCVPKFTGRNGGATAPGVTAETIRIVRRVFPESANSKAVDAVVAQAGGADPKVVEALRDEMIPYYEKFYELYGRKVEWITYESRFGNATNELQNKGREEACLDAEVVANELHAFAVVGDDAAVSKLFAECIIPKGVLVLDGASYASESWFRSHHPYAWAVVMDCERISWQVVEYLEKRIAFKKAKWAGDDALRNTEREFGVYTPVGDDDTACSDIIQSEARRTGIEASSTYRYTLDVSRFPDEAARGVIQFKRDGVTSLILACDPISVIFLTQSATSQGWYPEWVLIGVALTDIDNAARLYDQQQVAGHLFGMSQLGPTPKILGPNSEPGRVYKGFTGKTIPDGTDARYTHLTHVYNLLQAGGANLSAATVAQGLYAAPPGGAPDFALGYWYFQDAPDGRRGGHDHTEVEDSREVYWIANARSPADGEAGTYVETYGGRRFRNGEWPREDPPIYP